MTTATGRPAGRMGLGLLAYRAAGASLLDGGAYEGIEHDRSAAWQAGAIVLLSSVAAGIGAGGWYGPSLVTTLEFTGIALATWIAWAVLTLQIGTRLVPGPQTESNTGELLRTVGFAAAPGLLQAFAAFPRMSAPVFAASWIWMFVAMIVAVKHALDYTRTSQAIAVVAIAVLMILVVVAGVGLLFGPSLA